MLEKLREDLVTWNSGKANVSKQMMKHSLAIFGLVVTGKEAVRYDPLYKTAQIIAYQNKETSKPIPENQKAYEKLFAKYLGCTIISGVVKIT